METFMTLVAAFLGLLAATLGVWGEISRRRNNRNDQNKVIVQVVYPPEMQNILSKKETFLCSFFTKLFFGVLTVFKHKIK